jgi:processive 1,2-diacylglycerol beta-glucosyltransferase
VIVPNLMLMPTPPPHTIEDNTLPEPSQPMPSPPRKTREPVRCLILSSLTGGGHQSAARALSNALNVFHDKRQPIVTHTENVLEESNAINRFYANLYNAYLRHWQQGMFLYYHYINGLQLHTNPLLIYPMKAYAEKLLDAHQPTCIISVHPMVQEFAHFLQKLHAQRTGKRIPLFTVVTDPCHGFWRGWAHPAVQRYYTATEGATRQLIEYGIPKNRIACLGLPVAQRFRSFTSQERVSVRQAVWGNAHARPCLFFNGGWAGSTSMERLLKGFVLYPMAEEVNIIIQTGNNARQFQRLKALERQYPSLNLVVANATDDMQTLYALSDILVTKPGALTVFEALHQGIPIFIDAQGIMMPQEEGTGRYLEAIGAGISVTSAASLVQQLHRLFLKPEQLQRMSHQALNHANHGASVRIATHVLEELGV